MDLVNGPQDHGWCSGYTCQKRLSTFPFIVAAGKNYDMFMTGTTPQHVRFHLLNSDATQAVRLGLWYAIPQRLDVYVNDMYIDPTNAQYNNNGVQVS